MKKAVKAANTYGASAIKQLKGLEAVRERPGMYLGDPTSGDALHHLIKEVVDNSVDEHLGGHCDTIEVILETEGWCTVSDNGRGIPVDIHPEEGISALQMVMCSLHAGGKFDHKSYEESAGLHGVGVSAVNAVSEEAEATVHRDGRMYAQTYRRGLPTSDVVDQGPSKLTGTIIRWKRDLKIFKGVIDYDRKQVSERLQELAFLNPGLRITLTDARAAKDWYIEYHYKGGIKDYLTEVIGKKTALFPVLYFRGGRAVEIALTWTTTHDEDIRCYANNTTNRDGGTHMTGFKNGLTKLITTYAKSHNMLKGLPPEGLTGGDIREGIVAIVNVRLSDVAFSSQTKDKLVTPKAKAVVEDIFSDQVAAYFEANPGVAKRIAEKAVVNAIAREAARKAREQVQKKEWSDPLSLPGKLSDCQSKNPADSELFIVEGDSAGGSAKSGRDRKTQAILPLRGKVLNTERSGADAILENKEIGTLITALGCGIEQSNMFNKKKLRYHKIIIMTDADVDGSHIRTLLLTFFYRCMPQLLYGGYIYIAQPPLYGVVVSGSKRRHYFVTEEDFDNFREGLTIEQRKTLKITRYKGLGEMNAEDLWSTTLNPENRILKQVNVNDAIESERYFSLLMGDVVDDRRMWIEDNANYASRLDI